MNEVVEKFLLSGSMNIVQSLFDGFLQTNADFRRSAGLKMVVIRESVGRCCDWCDARVGVHEYKSNSFELFGRHKNCNCIVTTRTERGTYEDVWTHEEHSTYDEARNQRILKIIDQTRVNPKLTPADRETLIQKAFDSMRRRYRSPRTI